MLVPVAFVSGVTVTVVHVVHVVTMRDALMTAPGPVLVRVIPVDDVTLKAALVPVALVEPMHVTVMQIVDVVAMLHRDVTTCRPVLVGMVSMRLVVHSHAARLQSARRRHDGQICLRTPWSPWCV
jgi:hypothetical protein